MPIQSIVITAGGTTSIANSNIFSTYYVSGAVTLASSFEVTMAGTPRNGQRVKFEYDATIDLDGNHITFLGTQMPDAYESKKVNVDCYYNGSAWIVDYQPTFDEDAIITSAMIDSVAVAKVTGTASKVMEFSSGGVGQASNTTATELAYLYGVVAGTVNPGKVVVPTTGNLINELDVTSFKLGGTAITATGAEVNKLSGVTATTAQLNMLSGVTAGTAAASKAVVLSATSKIDSLDATVLKINGQTVTASGTELSELNGAGVVNADFVVLKDLAANGVVEADLALIAGAASAGVTAADIQGTKAGSVAKTKVKVQAITTTADIDLDASVVYIDLAADTTVTIPTSATAVTNQFVHVIVRKNPTATHDLVFASVDTVWNQGTDTTNGTITFATVAIGTVFHLVNIAQGVWLLEKAS